MLDIIFIGDALTAAGYRLAGIETRTPDPDQLVTVVEVALEECRVLVMTAAYFEALPPHLAREMEAREMPLMSLVPDVQGRKDVPDMEAEVRRALGIEV